MKLRSGRTAEASDRDAATTAPAAPTAEAAVAAPNAAAVFGLLFVTVLKTVASTIFALDPRTSINRTAIFLLAFSVVHVLGNLTFFKSAEAFNLYGYYLNANPVLKFVEYYLLAAAVMHVVMGVWLTYKMKRLKIPKKGGAARWASNAQLILSGSVLAVFIVLHLLEFKFGKHYETASETIGGPVRDLYKLQMEIFASGPKVAWYVFAVTCLGLHLWAGWSKATIKFGLPKPYIKPVEAMGHLLVLPVTLGFASCALYTYYLHVVAGTAQ